MHQSAGGAWIENIIGALSLLSSVAFIVLTYFEFEVLDSEDEPVKSYNIRMPKAFHYADLVICLIYTCEYMLKLYIS